MRNKLSLLLNQIPPVDLSRQLDHYACVALILRGDSLENLEIGYIQRAFSPTDRWSGQLAFPGGKKEATDTSDLQTAIRETREEIGIHLGEQHLIARLDDIQARKAGHLLDFYIRPFVFYFPETEYSIILDAAEVSDFFWIALRELSNPLRKTTYELPSFPEVEMPAIDLDRDPPLWGLTFLMTINLLQRLRLNTGI